MKRLYARKVDVTPPRGAVAVNEDKMKRREEHSDIVGVAVEAAAAVAGDGVQGLSCHRARRRALPSTIGIAAADTAVYVGVDAAADEAVEDDVGSGTSSHPVLDHDVGNDRWDVDHPVSEVYWESREGLPADDDSSCRLDRSDPTFNRELGLIARFDGQSGWRSSVWCEIDVEPSTEFPNQKQQALMSAWCDDSESMCGYFAEASANVSLVEGD